MGSIRPETGSTDPGERIALEPGAANGVGGQATSEEHGRRQFFETEVERLMDRLYGMALRLTRNRTDAEDLVAEALAKAWAHLPSLQDLQCFEKWVFRILVNTFIGDRRRQAKTPCDLSLRQDDGCAFSLFEKVHQPFLLWWSNPEERAVTKLLNEDIERALDALPDAFRVAVVLVDVQGHSYAEAAELLGVPVGTVRSRLARARSALQRSLWQHACDAGFTNTDRGRAEPQQSERTHRG
jgi:RNA polymerase sigma-70 factor, ECF subfamily